MLGMQVVRAGRRNADGPVLDVRAGRYESDEGYVLLCRSHAYSDLNVELINYDEEEPLNGLPMQDVRTRIAAIEP